MKRLIKKSEFMDAIKKPGAFGAEILVEFYKNPTSKEIQNCKDNDFNSIRGVILNDGTEYCWRGDILHMNVDSNINVDEFRFASEGDGTWIFDAHRKYTIEQMRDMISQYKDKLSKYGNLMSSLDIYFATDSERRCVVYKDINYLENNEREE